VNLSPIDSEGVGGQVILSTAVRVHLPK
jgi:hypothetical protein